MLIAGKSPGCDPTYKPTLNFQQASVKYPHLKGLAMMADRERKLSTHTLTNWPPGNQGSVP